MWIHSQAQIVQSSLCCFLPEEIVTWRITSGKAEKKSACFLFFGGRVCVWWFSLFYTDVFHRCSFTAYFQLVKIIFPLSLKKFQVDPELKLWGNHHCKTGILKLMVLERRKINVCALWLICNHSMLFSASLFLTCKVFSKLPKCVFRNWVRLHATSETKAITMWRYETFIFYFIESI